MDTWRRPTPSSIGAEREQRALRHPHKDPGQGPGNDLLIWDESGLLPFYQSLEISISPFPQHGSSWGVFYEETHPQQQQDGCVLDSPSLVLFLWWCSLAGREQGCSRQSTKSPLQGACMAREIHTRKSTVLFSHSFSGSYKWTLR